MRIGAKAEAGGGTGRALQGDSLYKGRNAGFRVIGYRATARFAIAQAAQLLQARQDLSNKVLGALDKAFVLYNFDRLVEKRRERRDKG